MTNDSTTRNLRNRTIDVPGISSELAKGKGAHYSNLSKIKSARKAGLKKVSLPHGGNLNPDSPDNSKPTLLVENSEEQLAGVHNVSLPKIN